MERHKPFNTILAAGLALLALANLGGYWLRTRSGWSESAVDGLSGFLMGAAIATLVLGLVRFASCRNKSAAS